MVSALRSGTWRTLLQRLGFLSLTVLSAGLVVADESRQPAVATATDLPTEISLELIMSDPDWIGRPPAAPYWADDSRSIYYEQKRLGAEYRDLFHLDLTTGEATRVADEDRGTVDVAGGNHSPDRKLKVYSRHGDIYVKDLVSGELSQLTRTAAEESEPFFLASGRAIAFRRDDSVFVRHLDGGLEEQAADLRLGKDPGDKEPAKDFLSRQQMRLFDTLRDGKKQRDDARTWRLEEQEKDPSRAPLPFYLGKNTEILRAAFSPAANFLLLAVADEDRNSGKRDQMPAWVTEDGYVASREVRPKVGTGDGASERLLLLDLSTHEQHELDLAILPGIADDPLASLRAAAKARQEDAISEDETDGAVEENGQAAEADEVEEAGKPRAVRFEEELVWSPDGTQVAVRAHSYDNKDRWIALVDLETKTLRPIHRLSHEAWINWSFNELGWLSDSRHLYFLSEESGYSQLYLYSLDDDSTRRLTRGDFVVSRPELSPDDTYIYYTANVDHPGVYDTYRVRVADARVEQVTRLGGRNLGQLSPDGKWLLINHSTTIRPPELYLQEAKPGAEARRLTYTISEAFLALPWVEPEVVGVESSHHERPIYSRYYPARNSGTSVAERPAVVFVHGAGYLQNAHKGWSGYFREFMFHTFLADRGYAVLDMDYRASRGYGAAWRTAIYRQMGTPELEDLSDGVEWLVSEHGVDRSRVGVYGGSYGGFMALMALFKAPDLFAAGAALRPVTDWAHYNHPYTSNILNTPDIDPDAYRISSPIEHAEGLTKPLLMCAPMQDDNVFFQDTVRLAQRLIELGKEDWEVAIYPVEPHGFREPASWLDEYRRIFKLFETHLLP